MKGIRYYLMQIRIHQNEKLIRRLFTALNDRDLSTAVECYSDDVTLEMMNVLNAKVLEFKGKELAEQVIATGLKNTDSKFELVELYHQGSQRFLLRFNQYGTYNTLAGQYHIDEPFNISSAYFMDIDKGKITSFRLLTDSFKLLRLVGRAVIIQNNDNTIKNYLQNLKEIGILRPD